MPAQKDEILLRVFLGESDQLHGHLLYEAVVLKARELHLAGATVVRGIMGYGQHSRPHKATLFRLSADLPVIVEVVDREEKIQPLLTWLDEVIEDGLVTIERVRILQRSAGDRTARKP